MKKLKHYALLNATLTICHRSAKGQILYRMGRKGQFLIVDNFVTVNGRKACNMSNVSEFCLE